MLVSTLYGHQLLVNPEDEVGGTIIRKGIYDKPYVYLLNKILKYIKQAIVNEFFNEIRQTYAGYTALSSLNKS